MASSSSHSAVRKALRGLEDGLSLFTSQLASETAELRRNVENRPRTGATYYRNVLCDLQERADGVGHQLAALEAVSTEAVSLEELVGHSVALYCQNHRQIQELESRLAQYGYRDLFAPLPPENPLDMLELSQQAGPGAGGGAAAADADDDDYAADAHLYSSAADGEQPDAAAADGDDGEALGELTNRLGAAHLGATAAGGASCDIASPPVPAQQRWAVGGGGGAGGAPRTTIKAMAPMTAAKALMRDDTPSSLASPEAMSPSMRELLGKYAASSSGGSHLHPASTSGLPTGPSPADGMPQHRCGGAQTTPPVPAYLSPAFQLAAMEQEVQMAHAEAAAVAQGGTHGAGVDGTPGNAAGGWQADDALYSALTATARKLAGKPSFMDAYRQKFPAIVASTERLLQTVEKQRRPAAAAAVAQEEAAAGPIAALAMAVQAAAGHEVGAASQQQHHHHQQGVAAERWQSVDEESTLDLMSQVLHSRKPAAAAAAEERTQNMLGAAAAASSTQFWAAASDAAGSGTHPTGRMPADQPPQSALAAASVLQSAPRSERSKPQLEEAIAAALGRSTTAAAPPPAVPTTAAVPPAAALAAHGSAAPAEAPAAPAAPAAAAPVQNRPAVVPAPPVRTAPAPPAAPPSAIRAAACPPPPPAVASTPAAAAPPAAPVAVPALRLVAESEFGALPTFIRSQLPLDGLNQTLAAVHAVAQDRGSNGFSMEDVQATGLAGAKHKVVVNSLVKLGRVQLHVARDGQGTIYLLV